MFDLYIAAVTAAVTVLPIHRLIEALSYNLAWSQRLPRD